MTLLQKTQVAHTSHDRLVWLLPVEACNVELASHRTLLQKTQVAHTSRDRLIWLLPVEACNGDLASQGGDFAAEDTRGTYLA